MLKSIAVVIGSYMFSVILVVATDRLLSRLFPGDFVKGRVPSDTAVAGEPWIGLRIAGRRADSPSV